MNALDKTKKVQNGLTCCSSVHSCNGCPYKGTEGCSGRLDRDALEVIDALNAQLNKRTNKAVEVKPGFIILTKGIVAYSENTAIWHDCYNVAVRVNDILIISNHDKCDGSTIILKDHSQTTILVQETLEEILGKIADMRGE